MLQAICSFTDNVHCYPIPTTEVLLSYIPGCEDRTGFGCKRNNATQVMHGQNVLSHCWVIAEKEMLVKYHRPVRSLASHLEYNSASIFDFVMHI